MSVLLHSFSLVAVSSLEHGLSAAKYHLNYHDVRSLHYLSQGMEPTESVPQLQSHFEAWKVSTYSQMLMSIALKNILCFDYVQITRVLPFICSGQP